MDANRMFNPTGRRAVQRCDSHSSLLLLDVLLPMHHEWSSINKGEEGREIGQGLHIQQSTGDSGNRKGKCALGNYCAGTVLALFYCFLFIYDCCCCVGYYLGGRDGIDVLSGRIRQHIRQEARAGVHRQFFEFRCSAARINQDLFGHKHKKEMIRISQDETRKTKRKRIITGPLLSLLFVVL